MQVNTLRFFHGTNPPDDVEYLRKKAEDEYGEDWSYEAFHRNTYLYTIGYHKEEPSWVALVQQHHAWKDYGIVGLLRKGFATYRPTGGITPNDLGYFGGPTLKAQAEFAREIGFNHYFVSMDRKAFARSMIGRLPKYEEYTGEKWYCDYNRYYTLGDNKTLQYCMWNNDETCFFKREEETR